MSDEGSMFAEGVTDNTAFNEAIKHTYSSSQVVRDAISRKLPAPSKSSRFKSEHDRYAAYMASSTFNCNVRFLTEAYKGKTYNMQYSRGTAIHGMDLQATFMIGMGDPAFASFATQYMDYFISHAKTGDPNKLRTNESIEWPLVTVAPTLSNVLDAGTNGYTLIEDDDIKEEDCGVFREIQAAVTIAEGSITFYSRRTLINFYG